jgi:DNA end-binding protein Ku
MRPTWKGSISFGLVYIPISVYPATREEKLSFRQLRKTDLSPIKYKKVAEADMKEVPADEIVKGFEYEKGRYIVLSDEDFEKVKIESTHSIDITEIFLQAVFSRGAKRRRKGLRTFAQGPQRNRQDRYRQSRDQ